MSDERPIRYRGHTKQGVGFVGVARDGETAVDVAMRLYELRSVRWAEITQGTVVVGGVDATARPSRWWAEDLGKRPGTEDES